RKILYVSVLARARGILKHRSRPSSDLGRNRRDGSPLERSLPKPPPGRCSKAIRSPTWCSAARLRRPTQPRPVGAAIWPASPSTISSSRSPVAMFPANAGGAQPPGLFAGIAPLTPTAGGGAAAMTGDLHQLFAALAAVGGGKTAIIRR